MRTSTSRLRALPWMSLGTLAASGFAIAGFAAAWTRVLPPVLGNPSLGSAVVAGSLLTGLLLGSVYGGRRADRIARPAAVLGRFLVGAGAAAVAAFLLLSNLERPYAVLVQGFHGSVVSTCVGAALAFAVLAVPAFTLGVALVFGWRIGGPATDPGGSGHLFGCSFAGLAGGVAAAAYALGPAIGARGTIATSAGLLVIVGLAATRAGREPSGGPSDGADAPPRPDADAGCSPSGLGRSIQTGAYAIFVASCVACAIIWTHLLSEVVGDSVYKDAAFYCVFFAGCALGSAGAAALAARVDRGRFWMGLFAAAAGILWLTPVILANNLPSIFLRSLGLAAGIYPPEWRDAVFSYFAVSLLIAFLPAVFMGATLPFASRALGSGGRAPLKGTGRILPVVLAGAFAAILLGHLVPRPGITSRGILIVLPWFAVAPGCLAIAASGRPFVRRLVLVALLAVALVMNLRAPAWNHGVFAGGIYGDPEKFLGVKNLRAALAATDVVFYDESGSRTVSVIGSPDGLFLKIDGKTILTSEDAPTQALAAHIPMLMMHDPHRVLVVGVGTGLTLRSVEAYPAAEIECVEPLGAALPAAERFSSYNRGALEDARLKVFRVDPSNYLSVCDRTYDVVLVGQGGAIPGFARRVRRCLGPGGVAAEAVSFDDVGETGFKSIAREFQADFPAVEVWWMGGTDLLLVASTQPLQTEAKTLAVRMGAAEVRRDLARVGIEDATALAGCLVMGTEALAVWAGEAGTQEKPAPRLARRDVLQALLRFDSAAQGALPKAGAADSSLATCRTARGNYFRSLAAFQDRKFREATGYLESAAASCPQNHIFALRLSELYISLSRELAGSARQQDALTTARRAVDVNPRSYRALYNLASLERGYDPSAALALLARAVELNPDYVPAYLFEAEVQLGLVDFDAAGAAVSRALSIEPFNIEAHHLRALCLTHQGRFDDARRDLASVLATDPGNADAWAAMAYTWLLESNLDKGERYYRKVLKLDPSHPDGLNNLAAILAEKGQYGTAIKLWEKALELDPGNPDIKRNIEEARKKMDQS